MPSLKRFRFLCLHGQGVNAAIFAAQTSQLETCFRESDHLLTSLVDALRSLLPSYYEFVFIDGGSTCDPAPRVADFYSGPYVCWYRTPTTAKVAEAHQRVSSVIENDGPFDAVMGFSQGAAVAASMILHHQIECPAEPPLFRLAIFMGSPIPFSKDLGHGIDTRTYFGLRAPNPSRVNCPTSIPDYLITDTAYLQGEEEMTRTSTGQLIWPRETYYQMFHPTVDSVRINVPTAHVYGWKDPWRLHSKDLVKLCADDLASVFEHDGGHDIPRSVSEEICDVIETAVAKANS